MEAKVSIIMGSTSDLPVMEETAKVLNEFKIPFEINALSAHRTPEEVEKFAKSAYKKGICVIIAAAGMAAHLPGVIASMTTVPVIGVPIKATLDGWDSILSILQMPQGIPVATVGLNAAKNAGLLAIQILSISDKNIHKQFSEYKENLKQKIVKANKDLKKLKFEYMVLP
ncbi:MAG: 5-(carboxyamino)imidazole ribonucleotide mutase [Bacteroidales bacterium]|nr:5-(carboxyamino)imidazole ribonucleotide mutase [Bacteroidales bacterium]